MTSLDPYIFTREAICNQVGERLEKDGIKITESLVSLIHVLLDKYSLDIIRGFGDRAADKIYADAKKQYEMSRKPNVNEESS